MIRKRNPCDSASLESQGLSFVMTTADQSGMRKAYFVSVSTLTFY